MQHGLLPDTTVPLCRATLTVGGAVLLALAGVGAAHTGDAPRASPCETWNAAHQYAKALWSVVRAREADLASRIGPRGAVVGHVTLDGKTVPLQAANVKQLRKLLRHLPPGLASTHVGAKAAVQQGCTVWDAQAEREGIAQLRREAEGATARAANLLRAV